MNKLRRTIKIVLWVLAHPAYSMAKAGLHLQFVPYSWDAQGDYPDGAYELLPRGLWGRLALPLRFVGHHWLCAQRRRQRLAFGGQAWWPQGILADDDIPF